MNYIFGGMGPDPILNSFGIFRAQCLLFDSTNTFDGVGSLQCLS